MSEGKLIQAVRCLTEAVTLLVLFPAEGKQRLLSTVRLGFGQWLDSGRLV